MRERRVHLSHTPNRPGYVNLMIDSIIYTISRKDILKLAEDLVRLLYTLQPKKKEKAD